MGSADALADALDDADGDADALADGRADVMELAGGLEVSDGLAAGTGVGARRSWCVVRDEL